MRMLYDQGNNQVKSVDPDDLSLGQASNLENDSEVSEPFKIFYFLNF